MAIPLPIRPQVSFQNVVGQQAQRNAGYNQWSERAIVQAYNGDTDSYDIIIQATTGQGANPSAGNVITNVRATIPAGAATFQSGDAVLVGYVSGQREHPIILGGGDHTGAFAPVVTLPTASQGAQSTPTGVQGTQSGVDGLNNNTQPACAMKITDPSTGSNASITIDCDNRNPDGSLNLTPPYTSCNAGGVTWSFSGVSGNQVVGIGPDQTQAKIYPGNAAGSTVSGTAYQVDCYLCNTCSGGGGGGPDCIAVLRNNTAQYDCNDHTLTCAGPLGSCGTAPDPSTLNDNCPPPGNAVPGGICPTSTTNLRRTCSSSGGVAVGPCDKRTGVMIAQGCAPCVLTFNNILLTATDSQGRSVSVGINVTSH